VRHSARALTPRAAFSESAGDLAQPGTVKWCQPIRHCSDGACMACTDEYLPFRTYSCNHTRITRTIFGPHGPTDCFGTRRRYEPKRAI